MHLGRDPLGQRLALDQLHHEEVPASRLLHPEKRRNMRVVQ